jgi:hypothetical protein
MICKRRRLICCAEQHNEWQGGSPGRRKLPPATTPASGHTPHPSPESSPSCLHAADCTIRPRQHALQQDLLLWFGLSTARRMAVAHEGSYSTGLGGRAGSPTTVNSAARDTATSSVPWRAPCADGTTIAATLDATLSHAVLMLHPSGHQRDKSSKQSQNCAASTAQHARPQVGPVSGGKSGESVLPWSRPHLVGSQ